MQVEQDQTIELSIAFNGEFECYVIGRCVAIQGDHVIVSMEAEHVSHFKSYTDIYCDGEQLRLVQGPTYLTSHVAVPGWYVRLSSNLLLPDVVI